MSSARRTLAISGLETVHCDLRIETVHGGAELEDLAPGEIGVEDGLVRQEADEALGLDAVVEGVEAIDEQAAPGRLQNPHEQAEEGGFARAVGAEQAADLSGRNREGEIVDCGFGAEVLRDACNLN